MKSAHPPDEQNNTGEVNRRVSVERKKQAMSDHVRNRRELLSRGASDPVTHMQNLFADTSIFAIQTRAVPVTEIDDEMIENMTDEELEQVDEELFKTEASSGEVQISDENATRINATVEAQALIHSAVYQLNAAKATLEEFCDATSPEERLQSPMVDRARELTESIIALLSAIRN